MLLEQERGGYGRGSQFTLRGGFQTGNPPTVFRDGTNVVSASKWFTVARTSIGLYAVTFQDNNVIPEIPFIQVAMSRAAGASVPNVASEVAGSWNQSARTFQIVVLTAAGALTDGTAGERVTFQISGAFYSVGTDPA